MGKFYKDGDVEKWEKLDENVVKVGFRTIIQKKFRSPEGNEVVFDVKGDGQAVAGVARTIEGKFIIVEQFRPGQEIVKGELPGGLIDPGQTPEEAMKMELFEESGYEAGELIYLGFTNLDPYSTMNRHHFLALDCKLISDPKPGEDEFVKVVLMDEEQFVKHILSGVVTERCTALLALAKLGVDVRKFL